MSDGVEGNYLPTRPGTQLSFDVAMPGRNPRTWLRHIIRHRLPGRPAWCPWCPQAAPLGYVGRPR